jgi:integrase
MKLTNNAHVMASNDIINSTGNSLTLNELANQTNEIERNLTYTLNNEQLQQFQKYIQIQTLINRGVNSLSNEMDKLNINLNSETKRFISSCSKSNSLRTQAIYLKAINKFTEYLSLHNNDILHASTIDVDNYINYLNGDNLSANTIRLYVAGIRCLYSYLGRHYDCIKNIFDKCKIPKRINTKQTEVPAKRELNKIINYVRKHNSQLACLIELMSLTGLRSGAFTNMTVKRSGAFTTITKGKRYDGKFDNYCMTLIRREFGAISHEIRLFERINAHNIQHLIIYYTKQMYSKHLIEHAYSAHDLRHYFACDYYKRTHDIVSLSRLLNHSNISVTGGYLTTLKLAY